MQSFLLNKTVTLIKKTLNERHETVGTPTEIPEVKCYFESCSKTLKNADGTEVKATYFLGIPEEQIPNKEAITKSWYVRIDGAEYLILEIYPPSGRSMRNFEVLV